MNLKEYQKKSRNIEFLYEMGSLRLVSRMWQRFFHAKMSSVPEHTFRVAWLALIIAKAEKIKEDEKILKMALVHDIVEGRTGDVDYVSRQYVKADESLAIKDILKDTSLEKDFLQILKEYEDKQSIAAKIVKDADNLDIDLELQEQSNQLVSPRFSKTRKTFVRPILYTETAKKYWDLIYRARPDDWHFNGRNRFNRGDWSKSKK
jgi:putative hydrolases of HD superfamily